MTKTIFTGLLVLLLPAAVFAQSVKTDALVIKGQVVDHRGFPVMGANISANPIGPLKGVLPRTTSNEHGEFSVVVNQTGVFFVTASKPADGYPNTFNPFYYPSAEPSSLVTVTPNQLSPFATVHFAPKAGRVVMKVIDAETAQPVKDVEISLCRVEAPKYCHRFAGKNSSGRFWSLVPSAPFTIQVSAAGYEDSYGGDGHGEGLQPVLVASEMTKELTISMQKSTSTIAGLLPAPKNGSPADGTIFYHYPRTTTLEWSAVPGAATYTVELELCTWERPDGTECKETHPMLSLREPPPTGIEGTSYQFSFLGAQPGRWRVWAVDARGRAGSKSPWSIFVYRR